MGLITFLDAGGTGGGGSGSTGSTNDKPDIADFRQAESTTFSSSSGSQDRHVGLVDTSNRTNRNGGFFDTLASGADHLAGSTDESVSRTVDQQGGGGVAEGVASFSGAKAWAKSEDAARIRQRNREAGGGLMGGLKRFDNSVRAGADFLLDNPNASVQEGLQEVAKKPTELATGREVSDEELAGSAQNLATQFQQATQGTVAEGSALDNPATKTAVDVGTFLGEAIVADPAKAVVRGTTGVSVDEGTTEGTVGAIDAFDVGVTLGTAGAGKVGVSAARGALSGSDEATTLAGRILGKQTDEATGGASDLFALPDGGVDEAAAGIGDEVSQAATTGDTAGGLADEVQRLVPASDEASQASEDVIDMVPAGDEGGSGLRRYVSEAVSGADEGAATTDDAASATDEFTGASQSTVDEAVSGVDETAQAGEESASGFSSFLDDAVSGSDETAQAGDEFAGASQSTVDEAVSGIDETAQAGDDTTLFGRVQQRLLGGADDAAGATDDAAGAVDETAQAADETAQAGGKGAAAADDAAGGLLGKVPGGKWGLGLGGAGLFLGGGLVGSGLLSPDNAPKEMTTASGHTLTHAKDYEPVERFPQGGRLYAVSKDFKNIGYWLLLGIQGRNLVVLDENGEPRKAKIEAEQFKKMMQSRAKQQGQGGSA